MDISYEYISVKKNFCEFIFISDLKKGYILLKEYIPFPFLFNFNLKKSLEEYYQ